MNTSSNRLPGLDGIRAIASLAVVAGHTQQDLFLHELPNAWSNPFVAGMANSAVSCFFVLSGYLITFLLLSERQQVGSIDFRAFYLRRVFRIFPLYYFVLALGFFAMPLLPAYRIPGVPETFGPDYVPNLLLYTFFAPHVALAILSNVSYAAALWSLGTEEWFYAAWPWLVQKAKRHLPSLCVSIIVALFLARQLMPTPPSGYPAIFTFLYFARFDCMAFGAIGAWLATHRDSIWNEIAIRVLFKPAVQCWTYIALLIVLWFGQYYSATDEIIRSAIFLIIIINISLNPSTTFKLNGFIFRKLGTLSFGIYCYNQLAIMTAIIATNYILGFASQHAKANVIFFLGPLLAIGLATLSYRWIEMPALRFKERFKSPVALTA